MSTSEIIETASARDARTAALLRYGILDTEPEPGFDDIVLLATRICNTSVALVSLVTADRQWFKSNIGFPASETPLSQSVCAHALQEDDLLVISDLTEDERTRQNALVTAEPHIRFYAGAVLKTPHGVPLGTLCVMDTVPRSGGLTPMQADSLRALARQVVSQMELRLASAERAGALEAAAIAERALREQHSLLIGELHHRLQNVLAMVQAMVSQSLRNTSSVEEARAILSGRILALSRAQQILFAGQTESADMATIARGTARLYDGGLDDRFEITGSRFELGAKATLAMTMMLHELATNATKYGSLSVETGTVSIAWSVTETDADPHFALFWRESGGPSVAPPSRRGFGSRLIQTALASSTITLDYPVSGVECRLTILLSRLRALN